jgi:hypothetical protein
METVITPPTGAMMTPSEALMLLGKYLLLPFSGGLIGTAIKSWFESRRFFKLEKARNVYGRWTSELRYLKSRLPIERIEIEFYPKRFWNFAYWLNSKLIKGIIRTGRDPNDDLFVRGGFYQPDQLMLDYRSRQLDRRQFGSLILKLDSGVGILDGNFIGYFDEPLVGTLTFQKLPKEKKQQA